MLVLFTASAVTPAQALRNPSAVYCVTLGYAYETKETALGTVGFCKMTGSATCPAWDFLQGKCGTDHSYCAQKNLQQRSGKGRECEVDNKNAECLLCILPDGSVREVSHLMNLSVVEGVCGDGACVVGENSQNCPRDCPPPRHETACDKQKDGTCDPNCKTGKDPDCATPNAYGNLPYILITLIALCAAFLFLRKRRK